jgi:hypothetical protein
MLDFIPVDISGIIPLNLDNIELSPVVTKITEIPADAD